MPTSLDYFKIEATERLERLSSGLIALERSTGDDTLIGNLFREVHSLKGAAGVSGLTDISDICHKMEDLLGNFKDGSDQVSIQIIDALLAATDAVQEMLAARFEGRDCSVSKTTVIERLDKSASPEQATRGEEPAAPSRSAPATNHSPAPTGSAPDLDPRAGGDREPRREVPPPCKPQSAAQSTPSTGGAADSSQAVLPHVAGMETVRLRVDMLESLANLTGELMVAGDRMRQRLDAVKELHNLVRDECNRHRSDHAVEERLRGIGAITRGLIDDFSGDLKVIDPLISEIHEQVLATRMLPISVLFDNLERFVRDCCRQTNKQAELHINGADTCVDRQVLEQLRDPMIHLIRNALSHGIESSDERKRLGKNPVGAIRLASSRHGERIRITFEDDGSGIDHQRILAKAVSTGVVTQAEAAGLSTRQIEALILRPGFSTAELLTDLSGRGFGMDVVARRLQAMRGTLGIESETGKFTRLVLEFPASVATLDGLLVEAAGFTYVLPTTSVERTAGIKLPEVRTIGGRAMANIDGQAVPLEMLESLLGRATDAKITRKFLPVVVVRCGDRKLAVGVERLLGTQTVVAKSLGDRVHNVRGVIGATILGTGLPALILDVGRLAQDRSAGSPRGSEVIAAAATKEEPVSILVVDDSITTRMMEQSILESAGYHVDCAVCAEDAIDKVERSIYQLFVVDVEMPGMNGFELTRKLRQNERFAETPIIIVTSLAKEEHRREGLEAGANAYLCKGEFDQNKLLETAERLVGK